MKAELKTGSVNQIIKGDEILTRGEDAAYVVLVLKGKVRVHADGVNLELGPGNFLGLCDIPDFTYCVTYTALVNSAVYVFPAGVTLEETVEDIYKANKEYGALMATALSKYIRGLGVVYRSMEKQADATYNAVVSVYQEYRVLCLANGTDMEQIEAADQLEPMAHENKVDISQLEYYIACCNIDQKVQKIFYNSSKTVAVYHILKQVELVRNLIRVCEEDAQYLKALMQPLMQSRKNLYRASINLTRSLQNIGISDKESMQLFDTIIDQINSVESVLYDRASIDLQINHDEMERDYFSLMNRGEASAGDVLSLAEEEFGSLAELNGALDQILDMAELDAEQESDFRTYIQQFIDLPNKLSTDDDVRTLRRNIIKIYYDLYEQVFLRDYEQEESSLAVDFFLRYGYLSEELLSENLREELLSFDRKAENQEDLQVYDMKEWLTEIYEGRKEPSKSEFDQDYQEYLREQKKIKAITEDEMREKEEDVAAKLHYEIQNMFKCNHRIMGDQTSIFVPFLYTDGCVSSLNRSYLSKDKVSACVRRIRRIDYSAFYREIVFTSDIFKNNKDYIMKEVLPDIILMPGSGTKGSMWQELSGRRRDSKGRFLMPIFFEGDVEAVMIDLFGRFRWELCRTMQGASWNNIQMKSLTSEYSDFVQFYRKNRELSDERKEKLKMQIQKCRNNTREVFVTDYRSWIRHESSGGMMLSKPVRELMATYCPFAKEIREAIGDQPMFRDAMARFHRERAKKQREFDLKFRAWEKDEVEIPQEVIDTRAYYREM